MSSSNEPPGQITTLLARIHKGESGARDLLYNLTFQRLRSIASLLLRGERTGNNTLQATALVAESFLKLRNIRQPILGARHFFNLSARAMRQVLIDRSRHRRGWVKVQPAAVADFLPREMWSHAVSEESIAVRAAWSRLQGVDCLAAESISLRCVEGLTIDEISLRQGREAWRVRADCDFGLRWMAERLSLKAVSGFPPSHSTRQPPRAAACPAQG